jgi:hypothetical protein
MLIRCCRCIPPVMITRSRATTAALTGRRQESRPGTTARIICIRVDWSTPPGDRCQTGASGHEDDEFLLARNNERPVESIRITRVRCGEARSDLITGVVTRGTGSSRKEEAGDPADDG